ncbi:hypothetical protein D3797_000205 [Bacillus subtilis]|nr:glycine-rich domain-containing protein-like [Bacillus inaquosorum]RKQ24569.1 hypothetical protein D3797_000205 [Bacillus subtilis]
MKTKTNIELPEFSFSLVEACKKFGRYFEGKNASELEKMVKEYQMFWGLLKKYPKQPFSPTKSIDEVWHLHMLHPQYYYTDCIEYFDGILSHNAGFGKTEEERPVLDEIFEQGNDIWEKEYGYRLPEEV